MTAAGDDPGDDVRVVVGVDDFGNELVRWMPAEVADDWEVRVWGRLR